MTMAKGRPSALVLGMSAVPGADLAREEQPSC